jgi:hypothetical protein
MEETSTCSCLVTRVQGKIIYINAGSKFSKNVAKLKYVETNKKCIHKEIKSRLNVRDVCYHALPIYLRMQVRVLIVIGIHRFDFSM